MMTQETTDDAAVIAEIVERLQERFPAHAESTIREVVTDEFTKLSDAHVRDFVGVLVEKKAKHRLKQLAS